jgi:type IX secretion system PorP/SprF family membrane protein
MLYSQEDGVVALTLPVRNSLKYNKFIINPTFSFVREQSPVLSFYNKREWVQFDNAPQTYLLSYSGRFLENEGVSLGLFQQDYGVLTTFGAVANFAHNISLREDSNLTFGMNLGIYKSGLNKGKVITNYPDPSLENIPSNSLITINPGINYGTTFLDFGLSVNNLILYNLKTSKIIENDPEKSIEAHIMYTGFIDSFGFFDGSKFSSILVTEVKKDKTIISGLAMLTLLKGIWAQAGYNTLYGMSGGIGINITPKISMEYNFEKGTGNLSNFGASHEIVFAYKFSSKNYDHGDDEDEGSIIPAAGTVNRASGKPISEASHEEYQKFKEQKEARLKDEAAAKAELLAATKTKADTDAATKAKLAQDARLKAEADAKAKQLAGTKSKADTDAATKAKLAQDARLKAEADAKAKQLAAAKSNADADAATKAKLAQDARLKAEADAKAKQLADAKLKADADAATKAKLAQDARLKAEADAKAKQLADAKLKADAATKAKLAQDARLKAEADAKAKQLADAKLKATTDAATKAKLAEDARLKAEADAKAKQLADAKLRADADAATKAKLAEDNRLKAEADAKAKQLADAKLRADADAATKAKLAEDARLKAEADAKAKQLADAKLKADADAAIKAKLAEEARLAAIPKDENARSIDNLTKIVANSKKEQQDLLKQLNDKVTDKEKDLKELKEENDLSDKGIYKEPKAFKSVSAENTALESLKSQIVVVNKNQQDKIVELDNLYKERIKKGANLNDETNQTYLKTIEELKVEQTKAIKSNLDLVSTLEKIKVDTEIEKKRRIKRAAFANNQDRYMQDVATLKRIKEKTPVSATPLKESDFDFGEKQSNVQVLKDIKNAEKGYYIVIAVHEDVAKRDEFLTKAVASGQSNINFFYDVKSGKYFIYYDKFDSIEEAQNAMESKEKKPYNSKMSMVKIEQN